VYVLSTMTSPACTFSRQLLHTASSRLVASSSRCFASTAILHDKVDDAPTAADIAGLQKQFSANPEAAMAVFSSTSQLTSGLRSTARIRDKYSIPTDEPKALGGTDTAPNPVEVLLAAFGTCQEITWKAYGQASGIVIDSVSVKLDGEIDLRGFLAVAEDVRPGFQKITGTVTVKSSASTEELEGLKAVVDAHCPVLDMLQAVPITIKL